jgi:hypothetical protein
MILLVGLQKCYFLHINGHNDNKCDHGDQILGQEAAHNVAFSNTSQIQSYAVVQLFKILKAVASNQFSTVPHSLHILNRMIIPVGKLKADRRPVHMNKE